MKKIFFIALFLVTIGGVKKSYAQLEVMEVLGTTITVNIVCVSSFTATQIDAVAIILNTRRVIEIQNLDTTNAVYCTHKNNVTVGNGRMIPANGGSWAIALRATSGIWGRLTFYCKTSNATGCSKVAITQGE
jgi:hypothetical protein